MIALTLSMIALIVLTSQGNRATPLLFFLGPRGDSKMEKAKNVPGRLQIKKWTRATRPPHPPARKMKSYLAQVNLTCNSHLSDSERCEFK